MTTTVAAPESPVARRADIGRPGTSLHRVIRSEWTKIWSVRSTLWSLLAMFAATVGFATLVSWGMSSSLQHMPPGQRATLDVTGVSMYGTSFGVLAMAVLGVLIISGEYSTGGIKATLTAVPQRMKVLLAKFVVFLITGLVVGLVTSFAAFRVSMLFWDRHGLAVGLGDPGVLRAVIGGALYIVGGGLFGFALGVLIRHSAGAITAAIGLLLVVPMLTNLLPGGWGHTVHKLFTSNAGQRITEVIHSPGLLRPWQGYAVFTLEWLVPLLAGAYLMRRRDA